MLTIDKERQKQSFKQKITATLAQFLPIIVIKNFLIYSAGSIILRSISMVMTPFTLAMLSPSDYGFLSMMTSFNNILVIFSGFGLRQVFYLEFFHCDSSQRHTMVNTIIVIYLMLAIPLFCLLLYNAPLINTYCFMGNANTTLISIMLLYCFMYFFAELFYQVLQYQTKALHLTTLQTIVALLTITANLTFLYVLGWGVYGMMIGYTLGIATACLVGLHAYLHKKSFKFFNIARSLKQGSYYLKLGLPFIPSVLFGWVLASGDRWVLARYGTMHDVGIYSLADMFGSLYQVFILYPMSGSYLPYLFQKFAENKHDVAHIEQWNKKVMYISMVVALVLISIGFFICRPIIYWLLPMKYHEAINYIWFILVGHVFLMGSYFASALIQFHKKTTYLVFALCVPAVLNIVLNILLIPYFAIYGCVVATVIAYICYFLLTLWYNAKLNS
ncbi:MAG: oligosaccharide flippase family protein [Candidatus Dependentiae bacterium]|nr:oligosaccharide flippase family protein [Candidatus Dependentiae bacterium]